MSEVTNLATRIALLQTQLSRNLAELAVAQRTAANSLVTGRLQEVIDQQQQELAQLQTQLAQAQQRAALGTASAGNLARDDQQATVPGSRSQAPQPASEVLTPDGRIQPQPDTTTATTATPPVTENSVDSGTNAPVRPITQTQATPAYGPGLLRDPGDADAQDGGYYGGGIAPAATQAGFGANNEDAGTKNLTRAEIDNIFNEVQIIPQDNVLDQYASYTYSASVYLMTQESYRTMIRDKKKSIVNSQLLFQSAGIPVGDRSPYFNNDYYIDKIDIESFFPGKGTGLSHNSSLIRMTVIEPNGITLIDNLDRAVQQLLGAEEKKKNYTSAVYLLVIRFYGYDEQGNLVRGGRASPPSPDGTSDTNAFVEKFYPMIIKSLGFKIANKAVEYNIEAGVLPYQIAGSSARGTIPYNIELSGQTLKDLLAGPGQYELQTTIATETGENFVSTTTTSTLPAPPKANGVVSPRLTIRAGLMTALNEFQRQLVADGVYTYPDEYSVEFVGESIATARIKPAGTTDKNKAPLSSPGTPADQKLPNKQSLDTTGRVMAATAGIQLVQFLDQVCRNSSFLEDQQLLKYDAKSGKMLYNGTPAQNVAWFKIGMEVEPKLELGQDPKRGDYAYKIKYIISPYKINQLNSEYFPKPRFNGTHKKYNYWFTGQNIAVINYEENLNALYQVVLSGGYLGGATSAAPAELKYNFSPRSAESSQGADGKTFEAVANAADILYSPSDLKSCDITIVGDPAWLQQGEAFAGQFRNSWNFRSFLPDGTINIDSGQVLFEVAFNKPEDYNLSTGLIDPNSTVNNTTQTQQPGAAQISRIYIAIGCTSSFAKGKFIQKIKGTLMLYFPDQVTRTNQSDTVTDQQVALNNSSTSRQSSSALLPGTLSTPAYQPLSLSQGTLQTFSPTVAQATNTSRLGLNLLGQNVLGGQSTRPSNIPGIPTSFGLPIGIFDNTSPLRLPGAVTDFAQTINDAAIGTQRTIRGVVNSVSNGTTQTVAAGDDAGTGLISSPVAETPYRSPETSDLISEPVAEFNANNDFFG
jgi:hypothetical protein